VARGGFLKGCITMIRSLCCSLCGSFGFSSGIFLTSLMLLLLTSRCLMWIMRISRRLCLLGGLLCQYSLWLMHVFHDPFFHVYSLSNEVSLIFLRFALSTRRDSAPNDVYQSQ
jgi:hypothetical protein